MLDKISATGCDLELKETQRLRDSNISGDRKSDGKVSLLYSAWSGLLTTSSNETFEELRELGISGSTLPSAPHLENCKAKAKLYERLDKRTGNDSFPPWTSWKGFLPAYPAAQNVHIQYFTHKAPSDDTYPPWVCVLYILSG